MALALSFISMAVELDEVVFLWGKTGGFTSFFFYRWIGSGLTSPALVREEAVKSSMPLSSFSLY